MFRKFMLLAGVVGMVTAAGADTIIPGGNVSGTWAAAGSPFLIMGEITVPSGQTLNIEPGVQVIFQGHYKLIVNGLLEAIGTEQDSILFTAADIDTGWWGIRFSNAQATSSLEYCHLIHGKATGSGWSNPDGKGGAIYCYYSDLNIRHCLIDFCTANHGAGIYCDNSSPMIELNTIAHNSSSVSGGADGGGITCYPNSNPTILKNYICYNSANWSGGGIRCRSNSHPSIQGNIISYNYAYKAGGGIACYENSNANISANSICHNWTTSVEGSGGGIHVGQSDPIIEGNTIAYNHGIDYGGGVTFNSYSDGQLLNNYIYGNDIQTNDITNGGGGVCIWAYCNTLVKGNSIYDNTVISSTGRGGGLYWHSGSVPTIESNLFYGNGAIYGGGIYGLGGTNAQILGNTICENTASSGGGLLLNICNPVVRNCIVWNNSPDQLLLTNSHPSITYSDIEGGWLGSGNIRQNPLFEDPINGNFSLCWPSPCIDAGDPELPLDPDSTRADMGAYYFNYSNIVAELNLIPFQIPIQIPASGGSFSYYIFANNFNITSLEADLWNEAIAPDSSVRGPAIGPTRIQLASGTTAWVRTQNVPASLPPGPYLYKGSIGIFPNVRLAISSFLFEKVSIEQALITDDWDCSLLRLEAESWNIVPMASFYSPISRMQYACNPNPFNSTTVARYELRVASHVSLKVYDTAGRLVQILMDGWREAGAHEVTFDASGLAAGIYFARLEAGSGSGTTPTTAVVKMVLLK